LKEKVVRRFNVKHPAERWTDVISHGELLRAGYDEKLLVDPDNLRFLFQGVTNRARAGKPYGQIPWRLGILEPAPTNAANPKKRAKAPRSISVIERVSAQIPYAGRSYLRTLSLNYEYK